MNVQYRENTRKKNHLKKYAELKRRKLHLDFVEKNETIILTRIARGRVSIIMSTIIDKEKKIRLKCRVNGTVWNGIRL